MPIDYSFVPRIPEGIAAAELERLRRSVVRDSHAEAILKEALLDRDYDHSAIAAAVERAGADFFINSFPGPGFSGANLLLRSEFVILGSRGTGRLQASHHPELFATTRERIRKLQCRAIIYRLCDYNPDELGFLGDTEYRTRGAERLIEDPGLLDFDFGMLDALLATDVPVDVLVPFVQFPDQFETLARRIRARFAAAGRRPRRIGTMIEVPANLLEIDQFTSAELFVFGPGDLLRFFYGGVARNDPLYEQTRLEILTAPLQHALGIVERLQHRTVFLAKSLVELTAHWDLLKYPTTEIRRLYMPSQVVPVARRALDASWAR